MKRSLRSALRLGTATCAATVFSVATPAFAFDNDVVTVEATASQRYDSNLFALPSDVDPPLGSRRSALTRTTGLRATIDKAYGLQQFDLYGTVNHVHYSPYHDLDLTTHAYGARWAWTLTPSLTGNISLDESRTPNNFSDTGFETTPNPRTEQNRRFDVNYRPGATLHPRLAIVQTVEKSAQITIEQQNARTTSLESAMVYEFRSANSAEAYYRVGRGRYFDVTLDPSSTDDSDFREREAGLAAHYDANGLSHFDGRLGYLNRKHAQFEQRDFGGLVAQLNYTYTLTGKTQLVFTALRTVTAVQTTFSSYSRDELISIQPVWSATSKITVRPSFSLTNRDFRGAVTPGVQPVRFHMRDTSLSVEWDVVRAFRLSAVLQHTRRDATDPTYQFTNRSAMITGALHF